jgi:hypothetical protein
MVEIYNEQIRDLLGDPRKKLDLKQRPGGTAMYLPDAVERPVRSQDEVRSAAVVAASCLTLRGWCRSL